MGQTPTLHLLYSCPFCWKVRGLLEHLDVDVNYVGVNGMKSRKTWPLRRLGQVPVFTDAKVCTTLIPRHCSAHRRTYNNGAWLHKVTLLADKSG